MFRKLDYQTKVMDALDCYLDVLCEEKANADKVKKLKEENPDIDIPIPDFTAKTFKILKDQQLLPASRTDIPFSPRQDGANRPVPNVTFKVPTGGGKTWLAVHSVSKVLGKYLNSHTGFVLWIVPNEAIYTQTIRNLKDRSHPYREALDLSAAGKVKIMEKTDRLNKTDIENNLCIMVLMLQSANRETKDSLKIFKDSGHIVGFIPPEGDQEIHKKLMEDIPNLDGYDGIMPLVKDSLGNALRIIEPIVVLDEGHKAFSDLALETLYGFNPSFVLELTATPKDKKGTKGKTDKYANILVEITGRELDAEGMIKMPLNLTPKSDGNWKETLNTAIDKLKQLQKEATTLQANGGNYIRPIMLIQVERTGQDQKTSGLIHSEDAKEYLLANDFDEAEIAIKTSDTNDLAQPENQNLLDPLNRIRAIITKQALQEGWDCPFAYVLCSLATSKNLNAMTQLVGRILRQPHAEKTNFPNLDECHVITQSDKTAEVIEKIKTGLEKQGLADLVMNVNESDKPKTEITSGKSQRRNEFKNTKIYLPQVMLVENNHSRPLDYETDIACNINWTGYDPVDIANKIPNDPRTMNNQIYRIGFAEDNDNDFDDQKGEYLHEIIAFDPVLATRRISDIVFNPFVARNIVLQLIKYLKESNMDDAKIGQASSLIMELFVKYMKEEQERRAEKLFRQKVKDGQIQFRLRTDGKNWKMPDAILATGKRELRMQKSLFEPLYHEEFNEEEHDFAVYLDEEEALGWWHRNIARKHYGIQGWKAHNIYPDFIFSVKQGEKTSKLVVLETKGEQLDNLDTDYKRKVLKLLTENFDWDSTIKAGEMEIVKENGETVQCELVLFDEYKAKMPDIMQV